MEAAFYLGYGTPPSIFLRKPSTKLHGGFNHSVISVSSGFSHRRRCHRYYSTGPVALDRSNSMTSGNEKRVDKIVRGAVGASVALACALSIFGCSCKMNFKAIACPPRAPRTMALKSLLDVTVSVNIASKEGRKIEGILQKYLLPLSEEIAPRDFKYSLDEVDHLKEAAINLMKCGKPDEALWKLKNAHEKYEKSSPNSEPTYNMTLALAQILICQIFPKTFGKYDEALKLLSGDNYKQFSSDFELRPTLYKAISLTMLDKDNEASELWEKFASNGGI